jgi:hypothetical protein
LKKWLWMVQALGLARQAAENLGEAAETAWVLHDLGTLAVAAGVKPVAVEALEQAKELYEQVGDHVGAKASSSALSQSASVAPSGLAVAAGVVAVAAVVPGFFVGGGTWYFVGEKSAFEAPSTPTAEVIAFGVGNENRVPGDFDERTGATPPSDAVGPGESLDVCEPLYLYDWVRFAGIEAGATSSEMSVDGSRFATDTRRWDGAVDAYTVGSRNYNGSGGVSSGDPIPYGRWELVVRIEGVEADRATVTILESC